MWNVEVGIICADPMLLELRSGFLLAPGLTLHFIAKFCRGYQECSITVRGDITRQNASKQATENDFREAVPHQAYPLEL